QRPGGTGLRALTSWSVDGGRAEKGAGRRRRGQSESRGGQSRDRAHHPAAVFEPGRAIARSASEGPVIAAAGAGETATPRRERAAAARGGSGASAGCGGEAAAGS